jgi:AcrR family transcriptional regulator
MTDLATLSTPIMDRAADAALALANDRPWAEISLRDIAQSAGVSFAELYAKAPGKAALLDHLARRFDQAALKTAELEPAAEAHDRLFEAVMARIEAMEPHRNALVAIARSEGPAATAPRLPRTARALLEASGIDTGGLKGAARIAGMSAVWARVALVWRDDEGALNRTMAEIDKQLKTLSKGLDRVQAGF